MARSVALSIWGVWLVNSNARLTRRLWRVAVEALVNLILVASCSTLTHGNLDFSILIHGFRIRYKCIYY